MALVWRSARPDSSFTACTHRTYFLVGVPVMAPGYRNAFAKPSRRLVDPTGGAFVALASIMRLASVGHHIHCDLASFISTHADLGLRAPLLLAALLTSGAVLAWRAAHPLGVRATPNRPSRLAPSRICAQASTGRDDIGVRVSSTAHRIRGTPWRPSGSIEYR